jgi:hypothetical protein
VVAVAEFPAPLLLALVVLVVAVMAGPQTQQLDQGQVGLLTLVVAQVAQQEGALVLWWIRRVVQGSLLLNTADLLHNILMFLLQVRHGLFPTALL